MKNYLNTTIVTKSFVLAGALTFGVLAGGHFTEAAGLDKAKVEQTVQVNKANSAKAIVEMPTVSVKPAPAVKVQPKVEAGATQKPQEEKVSKSQASLHASETAKLHAAPNSAVLGKAEKAKDVVTDETPVQESTTQKDTNVETEGTTDNKVTTTDTQATTLQTDATAQTEDVDKEDADLNSDSTVDINKESDSADTDAVVQTKEDEEADSPATELDKVNPSAANKAKSQASEHASDMAKEHAAANSAVLSGQEVSEGTVTEETPEVVTEDTAKETTEAVTEDATKEVLEVNPSLANKEMALASVQASENAKEHAAKNSAVLAGTEVIENGATDATEKTAKVESDGTKQEVAAEETTVEAVTKE